MTQVFQQVGFDSMNPVGRYYHTVRLLKTHLNKHKEAFYATPSKTGNRVAASP